MRSKFTWILTLCLAFTMQFSFAQEKTITGTVTDQNGLPLPGVNVVVKGTITGTQTDFDGNYAIKASQGQVLVFTYVGQKATERTVGTANAINVQMEEDAQALEEVVVTALGIERTARTIGYGVSTIKSEDLNEVRQTNVLGALQGKTSGLVISNQSGNVGGSQRILIRGNSSLSGTVQPLFVVDGVPISNQNVATGSRITGGFDFGNRAQDINPDDIDTITILKGASAAALYGSRAAGGVIIITTKKGKSGQRASVSLSSNYRFDEPLRLPDFQNEFAPGNLGVFDGTLGAGGAGPSNLQTTAGFGPSIASLSGQTFQDIGGNTVPFQAFPNNVEDFYETGSTAINSINVSGANEAGDSYRLSLSYTDQQGLVPNSNLNRTNIGFNASKTFSEKLKSNFSINYVRTNTVGTAAGGANDPNVLTNIVNGLSRITDIDLFREDVDDQGNQINTPGGLTNNPFFIARQNAPEIAVERFFGNASVQYLPFEGFDILARAGYDTFQDQRLLQNSIGTLGRATGSFIDDFINNRELTLDLIATYNRDIYKDLNLTARAGTQWNERVFNRLQNSAQDLTVPELFSPGNAAVNNVARAFSVRRILGVFGDVTLNYKNWLTLNATGRNDWSSTLPADNNSFFYPSVSLSFVFTDALNIKNNILSYGKLRGSYAEVGGDTNPFLLDFQFNPDTAFFGQFGTGGTFPFDGQLAFDSQGFLTDPNLGPEQQENFEVGIELGLFNNRVNIDFTYYDNETTDNIINLPTPNSTGFGTFLTNIGGIGNEGFELEVNAKVLQLGDFSWDIDYNFSTNDNEVTDLGGLEFLTLATGFNGIGVRAEEGQPLQLFGPRFARGVDANGNEIEDGILVDPTTGLRQVGQVGNLGQTQPDFTMGLTSTFNWKGFRLSTTFDWREGGVIFSNTTGALRRAGLAEETVVNNREVFVDPNTFTQPGGPGTALVPNTTPVMSVQQFYQQFSNAAIVEGNVFDATFIKWRELSLTYTFPSKLLDRTPIKALQIGVQGRNLALFNTDVPHIDPESGLGGAASQLDGIERGGVPTTRSIGFNLTANF